MHKGGGSPVVRTGDLGARARRGHPPSCDKQLRRAQRATTITRAGHGSLCLAYLNYQSFVCVSVFQAVASCQTAATCHGAPARQHRLAPGPMLIILGSSPPLGWPTTQSVCLSVYTSRELFIYLPICLHTSLTSNLSTKQGGLFSHRCVARACAPCISLAKIPIRLFNLDGARVLETLV